MYTRTRTLISIYVCIFPNCGRGHLLNVRFWSRPCTCSGLKQWRSTAYVWEEAVDICAQKVDLFWTLHAHACWESRSWQFHADSNSRPNAHCLLVCWLVCLLVCVRAHVTFSQCSWLRKLAEASIPLQTMASMHIWHVLKTHSSHVAQRAHTSRIIHEYILIYMYIYIYIYIYRRQHTLNLQPTR